MTRKILFLVVMLMVFCGISSAQISRNSVKTGPDAPPDRDIFLGEPVELDFKSREEIFDIRTRNVHLDAELLDGSYQPTGNVFGQIVGGRPWWGLTGQFCYGPGKSSIDGMSEETRFLVNPFLLLGLDEAKSFILNRVCDPVFPKPVSMKWSSQNATAEVTYDLTRFFRERAELPKNVGSYDVLTLVNYNARDLGFSYVRADLGRSHFVDSPPDSKLFSEPILMRGYIHLGGSCGYEGGCNNASPNEPDMRFRVKGVPATLHCQLWKAQPKDINQPPDFTFILHLN